MKRSAVALAVAALLVLPSVGLQADTISGHEPACETLAGLAYVVVDLRNRGASWDLIKAQLQDAMDATAGDENSLVADRGDETLVMGILEAVYHSPATNPRTEGQVVYLACMSAGKQPSLLSYQWREHHE